VSEDRTPPLKGQVYQSVAVFDSYDAQTGRFDTEDPSEAHVTTSKVAGKSKTHKLVIDLDLPAKLVPSSTPGHFHLYVDKEIEETVYFDLLDALESAGLIESGYVGASFARGFTAVRLPWIKKQDADERAEEVTREREEEFVL
jgi:hypothetical protein